MPAHNFGGYEMNRFFVLPGVSIYLPDIYAVDRTYIYIACLAFGRIQTLTQPRKCREVKAKRGKRIGLLSRSYLDGKLASLLSRPEWGIKRKFTSLMPLPLLYRQKKLGMFYSHYNRYKYASELMLSGRYFQTKRLPKPQPSQ